VDAILDIFQQIGGWKTIVGAALSIIAALLTLYLNHKKQWPFKPRSKKINELQDKFEGEIDDSLSNKKYVDYLNASDRVIDERERLRRENENDNQADK